LMSHSALHGRVAEPLLLFNFPSEPYHTTLPQCELEPLTERQGAPFSGS